MSLCRVVGKNVFDQDLNKVDDTSDLATSTLKQKSKKGNKPSASAPKRRGRPPGSRTAESTNSNEEDSPDEIDTLSPASVLADDMPGPSSGILSNSPPPRHVNVYPSSDDENETSPSMQIAEKTLVPSVGQFVTVTYYYIKAKENRVRVYVGRVEEIVGEHFEINFMRPYHNSPIMYCFPNVKDVDTVPLARIRSILSTPSEFRGRYTFKKFDINA